MNKLKKYLMLGMITLIMGATSINAHAEPTTESEASAGDADKAEDEDGEFKSFTENGKKVEKYVRKDGTYYTGWKKIKKKWYYFDGAGIKLTSTNVGIYELNDKGQCTNIRKNEKPRAHGVFVNSTSRAAIENGYTKAAEVEERIKTCYENYTKFNMQVKNEDVKSIRRDYNVLSKAEKVRVSNESNLADLENMLGITYTYNVAGASETNAVEFEEEQDVLKEYRFDIDKKQSSITIVVNYCDTDEDGINEDPKIWLESPDGEEIEIGKQNSLNQDELSLYITQNEHLWTQLDIASAEQGEWKIKTDIEVSFVEKEYIGVAAEIPDIDENAGVHSSLNADSQYMNYHESEDDSKSGSSIGSLIMLVLAIGAFVGLTIAMKKMPAGAGNKKKEVSSKEEVNKKTISKEEELELLKKELEDMSEDYSDNNIEDDMYSDDIVVKKEAPKVEFSEEEISESLEDYSAASYGMSSEDATTVLSSTEEDSWSEIESGENSNNFNSNNNLDMYEDEE